MASFEALLKAVYKRSISVILSYMTLQTSKGNSQMMKGKFDSFIFILLGAFVGGQLLNGLLLVTLADKVSDTVFGIMNFE